LLAFAELKPTCNEGVCISLSSVCYLEGADDNTGSRGLALGKRRLRSLSRFNIKGWHLCYAAAPGQITQQPFFSFIVNDQRLKKLKEISNHYCLQEGGSHGPDHSERVYQMAQRLGRELGADLDILAAAALLHDIGRKEESNSKGAICHAKHGATMAATILQDLGYQDDSIKKICHCIQAHRYRGTCKPETLEAKILFDADKLDSIGAIGIGRAFLFAGQIGSCLHNPELDPQATESYSTQDTAYREFQVKMSRVRGQLLTATGRKIADARHRFMEVFFDQLNREIYGSD